MEGGICNGPANCPAHFCPPRVLRKLLPARLLIALIFHHVGNSKGSGWIDYKWPNPVTKAVEQKSTYVEKVDDVVVGCGIYKN